LIPHPSFALELGACVSVKPGMSLPVDTLLHWLPEVMYVLPYLALQSSIISVCLHRRVMVIPFLIILSPGPA
jgi:hypothetical protein